MASACPFCHVGAGVATDHPLVLRCGRCCALWTRRPIPRAEALRFVALDDLPGAAEEDEDAVGFDLALSTGPQGPRRVFGLVDRLTRRLVGPAEYARVEWGGEHGKH